MARAYVCSVTKTKPSTSLVRVSSRPLRHYTIFVTIWTPASSASLISQAAQARLTILYRKATTLPATLSTIHGLQRSPNTTVAANQRRHLPNTFLVKFTSVLSVRLSATHILVPHHAIRTRARNNDGDEK